MKQQEIIPNFRLDLQGEPCPYPAVRTLEVLPELKSGEILEVLSDCPQSINNIPIVAKIQAPIRYLIKKP